MFKTYVMHYSKSEERKRHIASQLEQQKIHDYFFVSGYDAEDLNKSIIDKYYIDDKKMCDKYSEVTLRHNNCSDSVYKKLSKASISLCIKHTKALQYFIDSKSSYALFIEDDCIFYNDPNVLSVDKIIYLAPKDWDVVFIGGAFDHSILPINSVMGNYILSDHPATNTTSSFVLNKKSAIKIMSSLLPFYLPIDWQLNHVFEKNKLKIYHTNPYICGQLSNRGIEGTVKR
jgi:GR25 family glycosyltransferase involved in LPS biosynthesis